MRKNMVVATFVIYIIVFILSNTVTGIEDTENDKHKIAETEQLVLYYNHKLQSVTVFDKLTSNSWKSAFDWKESSLENITDRWISNLTSLMNITYATINGNNETVTESNSILLQPITEITRIKNGISIKFDFETIQISVTVDLWIEKNYFNINIPVDKIIEKDNHLIKSIEIMPFFGAAQNGMEGYFFYPDGCGGLMLLDRKVRMGVAQYTWNIYGPEAVEFNNNISGRYSSLQQFLNPEYVIGKENNNQAYLPVFGIKHRQSAFLAVAEKGKFNTSINLYPSGYGIDVNRISFKFKYRRHIDFPSFNTRVSRFIKRIDRKMIREDHSIKYVFLGDESANYSGMANAYRQLLIKKGVLKDRIKETDIPLALDLLMGVREKQMLYDKFISLTSFEEALEVLECFKRAGISSIHVNLIGWAKGGYGSYPIRWPPERFLGGERDLKKLTDYTRRNSIILYLQTNFIDALKKNKGFSLRNDVVYERNGLIVTNVLRDRFLLNPIVSYNRYSKEFLRNIKKLNIDGLVFERFGNILFSDYNKRHVLSRRQVSEYWSRFLEESSNLLGNAATEGGNSFIFNNVDRLFEIPTEDSGYFITDRAIPFYQMVIHGTIYYTSKPGNLFCNERDQKLRWIEYGCIPYYKLTYNSAELMKNTDYNRLFSSCYLDWLETAAQTYKEFNTELGKTITKFIISHEKVEEKVYEIIYDNGTKIIINYNNADIDINGRLIKAADYVVLKSDFERNQKNGER